MQKQNNTETAEVVQVEEIVEQKSPNASLSTKHKSQISSEDLDDFIAPIPQMTVGNTDPSKDATQLISDDQYLNYLEEIRIGIKAEKQQVSDFIDNFADMVINDGDATTSSKEALVNLVKIKTDLLDKDLKVADLMTRLKLKNAYAYSGPHLNAMQQNNFNYGSDGATFDRKEIIRAINHAKKKKE